MSHRELVMERFGSDESVAAWQASVALAVPVVGSPVIGLFCDKYGQRPVVGTFYILAVLHGARSALVVAHARVRTTAVLSAICLVVSFLLVGFTYLDPTIGLTIFSISLTIGPIALISAVPLVLPLTAVGTALGLYKCATNIGATILDPLSGLVQDIYGRCVSNSSCALIAPWPDRPLHGEGPYRQLHRSHGGVSRVCGPDLFALAGLLALGRHQLCVDPHGQRDQAQGHRKGAWAKPSTGACAMLHTLACAP
jgi:MFS family permease